MGFIILAVSFGMVGAQNVDPNIRAYGLGKTRGYVQTGPSSPAPHDFKFNAYIDLRPGGMVESTQVVGGLGFLDVHGPQALVVTGNGAEFHSTVYVNQAALDNDFPNDSSGNYVLKIDSGALGGPLGGYDYSVPFRLGGDSYPVDRPQFTLGGGDWTDGVYRIDSANPIEFSWVFSNYLSATDTVFLNIDTLDGVSVVEERFTGIDPGSYVLAGLTPGRSYIGRLKFARNIDNPSNVPGVLGESFYANETSFNFEAIPEPSATALLVLGLGSIIWARRRRAD